MSTIAVMSIKFALMRAARRHEQQRVLGGKFGRSGGSGRCGSCRRPDGRRRGWHREVRAALRAVFAAGRPAIPAPTVCLPQPGQGNFTLLMACPSP